MSKLKSSLTNWLVFIRSIIVVGSTIVMRIIMSPRITVLSHAVLILTILVSLPKEILLASAFDGSVKKSLDHLLEKNREYKKSLADWKTARQNVRSASAAAFPSIYFDGGYTRLGNIQSFSFDQDENDNEPPVELDVASENIFKGTLSIQQQLFSGRVFGAIRVAKSYQQAADAQILAAKNRLIRDYLTAYALAEMLSRIKDVNEQMVEFTRSHFEEAKLLHNIGATDNYALLRAEVEHLNSIPAFREAEKSYRAALSNLKLMLNLDENDILSIGSFDVRLELQDNQELLYNRAEQNRPEIVSAKNVAEAYKRAITVFRAGRLPSVSGFGNYDRQNQWDLFSQKDIWDNSWAAGINIHIPIFSGYATTAQIQKGRLDYARASEDESILKDAIRIEVQLAYDDYIRSSADFEAWFRNVDLASQGFEIAQLRWSNGDSSELELRDARIALRSAKANLSRAKYDKLRAKIATLFALGEIENVDIIEMQNKGK